MLNRKQIIGCSVIFCGLIVMIAIAGWLSYSFLTGRLFGYEPPETPAELREARIIIGAEFLVKEQFIKTKQSGFITEALNGIGSIKDVAVGELDAHPDIDVVIAGRYGAMVVDRNGVKQSQVRYEFEEEEHKLGPFRSSSKQMMLGDIKIIDIEGNGICEYMGRGSIDGAAVFDHRGKRLWSYGKFTEEKTSIDDLAAGDVDGDGSLDFVAGWNGVELFDRYGRRKWKQPWDSTFYQSEIVDVDGDGKNEIVHSGGRGLTIRDAQGQVVKSVDMPFYLAHFSICFIPEKRQPNLLAVENGSIWLTNFYGQVTAKLNAPLSKFSTGGHKTPIGGFTGTEVYKAEGVWVKLIQSQSEYLAVITQFPVLDRSILYIYSVDGKLVYQEVLPEHCNAIAILPKENGNGAQELLVGGDETVWRYKAR